MECLSPEQVVAYLRGGDTDARQVEAHVRGCPACGMDLLLARETLREVRQGLREVRPPTRRRSVLVRRRKSNWVPWAAAAAVLIAAIIVAIAAQQNQPPKDDPEVVKQEPPSEPQPEQPRPEFVKPVPPKPKAVPVPAPKPEPPKPELTPAPKPEPKPAPPKVEIPKPDPAPPKPEPKPPKPKRPTLVRPVVATVIRTAGTGEAVIGKVIHAGETFTTARKEFVALDLVGHGSVYFNEKSRAEFSGEGQIVLHEGEMIGQMERGEEPARLRTPEYEIEMETAVFDLRVSKSVTDLTIVDGHARVGETRMRGPSMMSLKKGRTPYVRTVGAGFATWVPDKLGAKSFTGWFEAEGAQRLKGFSVMPWDFASGARALVQTTAQGAAFGYQAPLPFQGEYVAWVRVRVYQDKAVRLALLANKRATPTKKLTGEEGTPWEWVGPIPLKSDRMELILSALSTSAFKEGAGRRAFPVVADLVVVSSDRNYRPPERLPENRRSFEFQLVY